MRIDRHSRKLHRLLALLFALPLLVVILSGLLLQVKKDWTFVQPKTMRGDRPGLSLAPEALLERLKRVPEAAIDDFSDVQRIDIQPSRGLIKVTTKDTLEIQLDAHSGEVLQVAERRSDLIESLHDGSFFGDWAKRTLFLTSGIALLVLWITGLWLYWLPLRTRRRRDRRRGGAHTR